MMRTLAFIGIVSCAAAVPAWASDVRGIGCSYRTTTSVTNSPTTIWDVDLATGAASNMRYVKAPTGTGTFVNDRTLAGIAMGPDGYLYGMDDHYAGSNSDAIRLKDSLVRIDPATGYATRIGDVFPTPQWPTGTYVYEGDIGFQPSTGTLFGVMSANASATLFTVNTGTGAATQIATGLAITDASAMMFGPDGRLWIVDVGYATSGPNPAAILDELDPVTGAILNSRTIVNSSGVGVALGQTAGASYDPVTGAYFVADGDYNGTNLFYSLDVNTGVLTTVGDTGIAGGWSSGYNKGGGLSGLTIVPEPSALLLLAAGTLLLRRR
jgi:hypothetical protein